MAVIAEQAPALEMRGITKTYPGVRALREMAVPRLAHQVLGIRYGGARDWRGAPPLFLGFILGDYVMAAGWSLAACVLGVSTCGTFIF